MRMLIMPIGPSGSGKSTLRRELSKRLPDMRVISFDDWRIEEYLKVEPEAGKLTSSELYRQAYEWYRKRHSVLVPQWKARARSIILFSKYVYVDNTNLKRAHRKEILEYAERAGFLRIAVPFEVELAELVRRDKERSEKSVGEKVVANQFYSLEPPDRTEFDLIVSPEELPHKLEQLLREVVVEVPIDTLSPYASDEIKLLLGGEEKRFKVKRKVSVRSYIYYLPPDFPRSLIPAIFGPEAKVHEGGAA